MILFTFLNKEMVLWHCCAIITTDLMYALVSFSHRNSTFAHFILKLLTGFNKFREATNQYYK